MNSLPKSVLDKLQALPPEDLQRVLEYVDSLSPSPEKLGVRFGLRGRFAHLKVCLSAEDIAAARQEAWAHFPRDIILESPA